MTAPTEVKRSSKGEVAREWWLRVCAPDRGDPASRARLKRCRSFVDVLTIPAAVSLARRLGATQEPRDERRLETALGLARVLAHVTVNTQISAIRAAGWTEFPGEQAEADAKVKPRLSEARFRRLLQTGGGEEQVLAFTRLIRMMDGKVRIAELARDYLDWHCDSTRQRWAFEYYAAGVAAPPSIQTTIEDEA